MKLIAAMALAIGLSGPAWAQDGDAFQTAARDTALGPYDPVAVLLVAGAFGQPADAYSFYVYWDPPSPATAAGRHRAFAVRKASRTETAVLWATSSDCPAIMEALEGLEAIPSPRIDMMGVGEDGGLNLVLDGIIYDLWTRSPAWPGATGYSLRMSGNVNTPLASWATAIEGDLASCWRDQPPLEVRPSTS